MPKAQAWYLDVVMAVFIFTAGIIAYHHYSLNTQNADKERIKEMSFQADALSSELLGSGYPEGWDSADVIKIGLTHNDQRIDDEKWSEFAEINYSLSKQLLGITYDFAVFFEGQNSSILPIGGICAVGSEKVVFTLISNSSCMGPILPTMSDLISRERYVFAKGKIMKMNVYVFS